MASTGAASTQLSAEELYPGAYALSRIYKHVYKCDRCPRSQTRKNVVFGYGQTEHPVVAFVSGSPSGYEDAKGFPLSTPEIKVLFDRLLARLQLSMEHAYVLNAVACAGVTPIADALKACRPVWESQVRAVAPRTLVLLGEAAAQAFGIEKLHDWGYWEKTPVCATYSMESMFSRPALRNEAWEALKHLRSKSRA